MVALTLSNFVYFYVFHGSKAVASSYQLQQDALKDLTFGFIAGKSILTIIIYTINVCDIYQNVKSSATDDYHTFIYILNFMVYSLW